MDESLNDLTLSKAMVAALYTHSLVVLDNAENSEIPKKKPAGKPLKFLGNNLRKVTVLVNDPEHTFLPENELNLLTKLLAACQMNTGDVAIINVAHTELTVDQIFTILSPTRLISFEGLPGKQLFSIDKMSSVEVLHAPSLKQMLAETADARQLKSKLWAALKLMFEI